MQTQFEGHQHPKGVPSFEAPKGQRASRPQQLQLHSETRGCQPFPEAPVVDGECTALQITRMAWLTQRLNNNTHPARIILSLHKNPVVPRRCVATLGLDPFCSVFDLPSEKGGASQLAISRPGLWRWAVCL